MLTVAFATHDGEQTLPRVFEALAALEAPLGGWRLVVVDNASTDATPALLEAWRVRGDLPLTVLREDGRGKNRALNRALDRIVAEDASELVVLTDDDVLPACDWLVRMQEAAARHPDYALFAGTIRPAFPGPTPPWLDPAMISFGVLFAATDCAEGPCPATSVWGPNMAIRTEVFRRGHRFDPAIGPGVGSQYPMGSETELTVRLERSGHRAWFAERAVVSHLVRPHQMSERFIEGRAYRHGFGICAYEPRLLASRWPTIGGLPLRALLEVGWWLGLARVASFLPTSRFRLRALYQGAWWRGVLDSRRMKPARA